MNYLPKHNTKSNSGYSLVEVLVAVSILLIAIVGPMTIASKGLKNASEAKVQNTAFFLAQEGLEAVVKAREDNALKVFAIGGSDVWDDVEDLDGVGDLSDVCTEANPCGVDVDNGMSLFECDSGTCDLYIHTTGRDRYSHNSTGGTPTAFHREIILAVDGDESIYVRSIVSWNSDLSNPDTQVELSTYLYNIYAN